MSRRARWHLLWMAVIGIVAVLPPPSAVALDCGKALHADEAVVCGDARLSKLDETLNRRYREALAVPDSNAQHIARNFQADRRACGRDRACILSAYISGLWELSSDRDADLAGISAALLNHGVPPRSTGLPGRAGQCASTTILSVHPRVSAGGPVTDEDYDGGTGVDFQNDGYQVSYSREETLLRSKAGDPVTMCLVEIDRDCAVDDAGRLFLTTNERTGETWVLPDAQHKCGG